MHPINETELIQAHKRGNTEAFNDLVKRHLQPVYRYLFRLTQDVSTAEDLTQETFLKAWKNFWRFDQKRPFKTWLFTIARNTAFDYFKKKKPLTFSELEKEEGIEFSETIQDERLRAPELMEQAERAADMENALAHVPLRSRSVLLLREAEDLTFQEISEVTKESINTVKSRYYRALELLRKSWDNLKK